MSLSPYGPKTQTPQIGSEDGQSPCAFAVTLGIPCGPFPQQRDNEFGVQLHESQPDAAPSGIGLSLLPLRRVSIIEVEHSTEALAALDGTDGVSGIICSVD